MSHFSRLHHEIINTQSEIDRIDDNELGDDTVGDGIIDNIKDFLTFKKGNGMSRNNIQYLEKHGNAKITQIYVCREPVHSIVQKVLNILSLGTYKKEKKRLGFDEIFHLGLVLKLNDGSDCLMEKTATLEIKPGHLFGETRMVAPNGKILTLNEFVFNAEKYMGSRFFSYNADINNCQVLVIDSLKANNLLNPEIDSFVKQDTKQLFSKLPGVTKGIIDTTTHLGALFNRLLGKGLSSY